MGDKFTEIAADRPGGFDCLIGKPVKFINESNLPMLYRNRTAVVIYQTENFLVIAFEECDGWAPRVCSVNDVEVIKDNDCYEDDDLMICGVDGCRNTAIEKLYVTSGDYDLDKTEGILSVGIPMCSDCYKVFLSSHALDEVIDNVNEKYNVRFQIAEKVKS